MMKPEEFAEKWLAEANRMPKPGEMVLRISLPVKGAAEDAPDEIFVYPVDYDVYPGHPFVLALAKNYEYSFALSPPQAGFFAICGQLADGPSYDYATPGSPFLGFSPMRKSFSEPVKLGFWATSHKPFVEPKEWEFKYPDYEITVVTPNNGDLQLIPEDVQLGIESRAAWAKWYTPKQADYENMINEIVEYYDHCMDGKTVDTLSSDYVEAAEEAASCLDSGSAPDSMKIGFSTSYASSPFIEYCFKKASTRQPKSVYDYGIERSYGRDYTYRSKSIPNPRIDPSSLWYYPLTETTYHYSYNNGYVKSGAPQFDVTSNATAFNYAAYLPELVQGILFEFCFYDSGGMGYPNFSFDNLDIRLGAGIIDTDTDARDRLREAGRMRSGIEGTIVSIEEYLSAQYAPTIYLVRVRFNSFVFQKVKELGLFCIYVGSKKWDKQYKVPKDDPIRYPRFSLWTGMNQWDATRPWIGSKSFASVHNSRYPLMLPLYGEAEPAMEV